MLSSFLICELVIFLSSALLVVHIERINVPSSAVYRAAFPIFGLEGSGEPSSKETEHTPKRTTCPAAAVRAFKSAVATVTRLRERGDAIPGVARCLPEDIQWGWRQPGLSPVVMGNKCEPWWRREVIFIVDQVLRALSSGKNVVASKADKGRDDVFQKQSTPQVPQNENSTLVGAEWGSGTSSLWLMRRLRKLHVAETEEKWLSSLRDSAASVGVGERLSGHVAPRQEQAQINFELGAPNSLDLVSVDGRDRVSSLQRAVRGLLKENAGLLLLDNSDRSRYRSVFDGPHAVPKQWLRYSAPIPWPERWSLSPGGLAAPEYGWNGNTTREKTKHWIERDNLETTVWLSLTEACATELTSLR